MGHVKPTGKIVSTLKLSLCSALASHTPISVVPSPQIFTLHIMPSAKAQWVLILTISQGWPVEVLVQFFGQLLVWFLLPKLKFKNHLEPKLELDQAISLLLEMEICCILVFQNFQVLYACIFQISKMTPKTLSLKQVATFNWLHKISNTQSFILGCLSLGASN